AVNQLHDLLASAVKSRMHADVPLGAFLSGGIDSSTVAALMQAGGSSKVRTYSIGFEDRRHNEAVHAAAVAKFLGTDHEELYVTAADALQVVPQLPSLYDEPFADSSQIPTFLLSRLTRRHVTVALSGDAGDELFAGYNRHRLTASMWPRMRNLPPALRRLAARALLSMRPASVDRIGRAISARCSVGIGDKLHKAATVLESRDEGELYRGLIAQWP